MALEETILKVVILGNFFKTSHFKSYDLWQFFKTSHGKSCDSWKFFKTSHW